MMIIKVTMKCNIRLETFSMESKRKATEDDDLFHFVAYVPYCGRLFELDGLHPAPIDHGMDRL